MSLPKIRDFTDFNHYPSDPQPTTDADMQDYMQNQNDILTALTKRLWQPQTAYKLGDIVASDAMADGLVAVCTIAGVTSDIEPEWGVNEATVIDNSCTWIMRPAYCYGLATEGDVQSVHDGGSAEESRLLSLGVLDKIFALIKARFTDLFGSNDVLPIEHGGTGQTTKAAVRNTLGLGNTTGALPVANGGTGATTIADIIKALFGSSAIGSTSKPLYYNGATFAACSASVGAANNGGIVAASLGTNGYVKFANGLILQWGKGWSSSFSKNNYATPKDIGTVTISTPISMSTLYQGFICTSSTSGPSIVIGFVTAYSGNSLTVRMITSLDAGSGGSVVPNYIVLGK
nr:MAG TPA: Putative tail fiber protein fold, Tail fiber, receptor [Caudoviricetes sp.]